MLHRTILSVSRGDQEPVCGASNVDYGLFPDSRKTQKTQSILRLPAPIKNDVRGAMLQKLSSRNSVDSKLYFDVKKGRQHAHLKRLRKCSCHIFTESGKRLLTTRSASRINPRPLQPRLQYVADRVAKLNLHSLYPSTLDARGFGTVTAVFC